MLTRLIDGACTAFDRRLGILPPLRSCQCTDQKTQHTQDNYGQNHYPHALKSIQGGIRDYRHLHPTLG